MEAIDLSSPAYWESTAIDIRLNPRRPVDSAGLRDFLGPAQPRLDDPGRAAVGHGKEDFPAQ